MSALAPGLGASDNPKTDRVVSLPGTEERARRLAAEVERLASLSPTEWRFYLEEGEIAKKYGIGRAEGNDRGHHQGGREEAARRAG